MNLTPNKSKNSHMFTYLLLSVFLTVAIFMCFLFWQHNTLFVKNNDVIISSDSIYKAEYFTVPRSEYVDCSLSFSIDKENVDRYVLAFFRFTNMSVVTDKEISENVPENSASYKRIKSIPLSEFDYDESNKILNARWSSDASYFSGSVYLMPSHVFSTWENLGAELSYVSLGLILLMTIYSLFLFGCKPDEYYLTNFYVYTITFLFIVVFNSMPFGLNIKPSIYNYLQPVTTMVHSCVGLLAAYDFFALSKRKNIIANILIFPVAVVYSIIMNTLGGAAAESIRLCTLLILSCILISASSKHARGAVVLLMCHSLRLGIILAQMSVNLGIIPDWFQFTMLRSNAFIEFPFAIAFMFCITQRFADKFRESEQLTKQLSEFNQQLDDKVQLRTRQYKQEQELRHNMMLNVFHDLRTPLFTVQGGLDILSEKLEDEKELVDVMKHRLAFASDLTESLFLQAKLEDNEWIIPFSNYSLSDILPSVCEAMSLEAEKNGLNYTYDIIEGVTLWANKEQLQRALQNLIVNSIHYTDAGGSVSVKTSVKDDCVRIAITDTGKGMSEEDLKHLFTKYYRSNKHMDSYSTGLGLSIAQSIIERHKGNIEVVSKPGEGTSMTIVLPVIN